MVERGNYIVVYEEDPFTVRVLRVLHAAQQWPPQGGQLVNANGLQLPIVDRWARREADCQQEQTAMDTLDAWLPFALFMRCAITKEHYPAGQQIRSRCRHVPQSVIQCSGPRFGRSALHRAWNALP